MFDPKPILKSAPIAAHEPAAPIPVETRDPSIYGFKRVGEPVNYEDVEYIEDTTISSPTLPPVDDPELIQFQKELDRRYFNLNRDVEKEKVCCPGHMVTLGQTKSLIFNSHITK